MNFDVDNENLKGKKIYRILLFSFIGVILIAAVYVSLRRTAARFSRDFMSPFLRIVTLTEDTAFFAAQRWLPCFTASPLRSPKTGSEMGAQWMLCGCLPPFFLLPACAV